MLPPVGEQESAWHPTRIRRVPDIHAGRQGRIGDRAVAGQREIDDDVGP